MAFSGRHSIPLPMNSAYWPGLSGKLHCAFSREMEGTEMEGMMKVSQRVARDLLSCRWLILTTRCLSGDALSWSALTTRKYLKEIRWGCGSNLKLSPALKDSDTICLELSTSGRMLCNFFQVRRYIGTFVSGFHTSSECPVACGFKARCSHWMQLWCQICVLNLTGVVFIHELFTKFISKWCEQFA